MNKNSFIIILCAALIFLLTTNIVAIQGLQLQETKMNKLQTKLDSLDSLSCIDYRRQHIRYPDCMPYRDIPTVNY